jgi:hypothetical protein
MDVNGHSCCHHKNHCGQGGPAVQSHQPVATPQIVPIVLTEPVLTSVQLASANVSVVQGRLSDFSFPPRTAVLRL